MSRRLSLRRRPARLAPDNLRTGVDKPDLYDPKLNRSYAELAAHYGCLIDPHGHGNPGTRPGSNARCRMCGTRSGAAGSSSAWSRCRPRRNAGPRRPPGAGRACRWRAPRRPRCSRRWRRRHCGRCPRSRSCSRRGRGRRSARTSTPRWTGCCTRCRGGTSARPPTCASTATMVQFFIGGRLVKTHPRKARGKQTDFGDYPPEKIAFHMRTRPGAASRPPPSARRAVRSSPGCWPITRCTGCGPRRA